MMLKAEARVATSSLLIRNLKDIAPMSACLHTVEQRAEPVSAARETGRAASAKCCRARVRKADTFYLD
jgi:hypothetical protein